MTAAEQATWTGDWLWALPLIVFILLLHVAGLAGINARMVKSLEDRETGNFTFGFVVVMGTSALLATLLHGLEAIIWALAYWGLGALPSYAESMLYSLNAITSYGHESLVLANHWRLMGALEALNGLLLFGLTTAFLYGHLQRVWPLSRAELEKLRDKSAAG